MSTYENEHGARFRKVGMRAGKLGPTVEAVGPEGETVWIPLVTWDKYFTQVEE